MLRCGLRAQRQGLSKRKLSHDLLQRALAAGPRRTGELHAWLQAQGADTAVSMPYLVTFLRKMVQEGRVLKVAHGTYALEPAGGAGKAVLVALARGGRPSKAD